MEEIFHNAQLSIGKHNKCTEQLAKLQAAADADAFASDFFNCVACFLTVFKREPAVERLVEFVVGFVTRTDAADPSAQEELLNRLCLQLLRLASAKEKAVRFRVTQLVGRIMNSMPEEAEVSEELCEGVEVTMLQRCHDKVPVVRAWALRALFRLQDPHSREDTITGELLRAMAQDPSKEVRMAATSTIAPSRHAIQAILDRTRDASEEVRLHALKVLISKVEMKWLSISQRTGMLSAALNDRQPAVRAKCGELLVGWVRKQKEPVVCELLKGLDVASYESAAAAAVRSLLDDETQRPAVAQAAAEWRGLSSEALLSLRVYLEWLSERAQPLSAYADALEETLPELPEYCEALNKAVEAYDTCGDACVKPMSFALVQLLKICPNLDMTNEHGRAMLEVSLCALLKDPQTAEEMLPPLVEALRSACGAEPERFQRLMLELISEVEDPLEGYGNDKADPAEAEQRLQLEQMCMQLQGRLGELHTQVRQKVVEEDEEAVESLRREAATAQDELTAVQQQLSGERAEEADERSIRSLRLAELLLQSPQVRLRQHEQDALPHRFLPFLQSPRPVLRTLALKCLGLICLHASHQASKLWPLFVKAVEHDQPAVQRAALVGCVDMAMVHTATVLRNTDNQHTHTNTNANANTNITPPKDAPLPPLEDEGAQELLGLLTPLLRLPACPLRTTAAFASCKLLHTGRLLSSSLAARLLLLYFLPREHLIGNLARKPTTASTATANANAGADADATADADAVELEPHQFLGVFLASAPPSLLAPALILAARAAFAAAPGSADAAVSVEHLLGFGLALLRPQPRAEAEAKEKVEGQEKESADENESEGEKEKAEAERGELCEGAALSLCCEALAAASEAEGRVLPKLLPNLWLPEANKCKKLKPLQVLLERLEPQLTDRTALRALNKFQERVARLIEEAADSQTDPSQAAGGDESLPTKDAEEQADAILDAHLALRSADSEVSAARAREASRAAAEAAAAAERRASTPTAAAKPKPRRKLAKGGATPGLRAKLDAAHDENHADNIGVGV